jgi:hypothetical protein
LLVSETTLEVLEYPESVGEWERDECLIDGGCV